MLSIISPSIINPKDIPAYELYTSECDELYFEQGVIYNEAKVEYHDELINPHVVECTVVEIFGKEINDMIVMFPEGKHAPFEDFEAQVANWFRSNASSLTEYMEMFPDAR